MSCYGDGPPITARFGGKRSVDKLGWVVNIATDSDLIGEPSVEIGRPVFVAA